MKNSARAFLPAWTVCLLLLGCLTGCILGGDDGGGRSSTDALLPGVYRGDYGAATDSFGYETEIVVGTDGQFRFFGIQDSTPWFITKTTWQSRGKMLFRDSVRSHYSHTGNDFYNWDTLPPDTTALRFLSREAFQWRGPGDTVWANYHRIPAPPAPAPGTYEFTETYPDGAHSVSARTVLIIAPNGAYKENRFVNGIPNREFEGQAWLQSGSFLVVRDIRARVYDPDSSKFNAWEAPLPVLDFEYVTHVRAVQPDSFQQWIVSDASNQGGPYWATWRRTLP